MRLLVAIALAFTLSSGPALAAEVTRDFQVTGWSCGGCAKKTASIVRKLPGVRAATPDVDRATLTVSFEDTAIAAADIAAAIRAAGYSCPVP